jgi:GT2 family glycosyltransferase
MTPGTESPATRPALTVCVVTYERPEFLLRCLAALHAHRAEISQIVVVDASATPLNLPPALKEISTYIHAPELAGWMTRSRNEALLHASGDVIAFLDDDVVVRPGWAAALRAVFAETLADAVAGRTCNGLPGEESYPEPIGRLRGDGTLSEGFAAQTDGRIPVDHGIGANMAFTRRLLCDLGGFRDDYPGTALREDTDIFLRVGTLGRVVLFDPRVAVDHLPAPHVRGRRFDTRYKLYGRRNHVVLLARHGGLLSPLLRRWMMRQFAEVRAAPGVRRKIQRLGVVSAGVLWGITALPQSGVRTHGMPVERRDPRGLDISRSLDSQTTDSTDVKSHE